VTAGVLLVEHVLLLAHPPAAAILAFAVLSLVLLGNARDPALALACVGLVTISWDRVSVRTGGMTLKPAYIAFTLALLVEILRNLDGAPLERIRERGRLVRVAVGASLLLLAVATVRGGYLLEGGRQLFVIVVGALVPAWVCFRLGRTPERRRTLVAWALAGAGLAAAFGIYQFGAGYLGLPAILSYTGTGAILDRTAGLSYEPAFFAMYLIAMLPAVVVLLLDPVDERTVRTAPHLLFGLLVAGVLVSNARAGYLALPLAVVVPLVSRRPRAIRSRPVMLLGATFAGLLLLSVAVRFDAPGFVAARLGSIADTTEQASNAPRLQLYEADRRIAGDHLPLGIGPGALGYYLPEYGYPVANPDLTRVVANNIWLQAVLDGGILGPVGVAVVIGVLFRVSRRSRDPYGRWLAFGAFLALTIGGMLTSNFWDARYWSLIGLALAADMAAARTATPALQ